MYSFINLLTSFFLALLLAPLITANPIAAPGPQVSDVPSLLTGLLGTTEPPLMTSIHSPECVDLNQGTAMCCKSMVDGGNALVQLLAGLAHYELTKNTVNGLVCHQNFEQCPEADFKVCCDVIALAPVVALYCQNANV